MKKNSIAVVGQGFVGSSLSTVFIERGFDVYAYDKSGKYAENVHYSCAMENDAGALVKFCQSLGTDEKALSNFSGVCFLCLPTPMQEDGSCDLSIIDGVLEKIANVVKDDLVVVIKSTVPPGSCEAWNKRFEGKKIHVVHSPEFLREASALEDMRNQDRIVLGGPRPWVDVVRNVFRAAFPTVPVHKTSSTNSEMVKYFTNCFLATKLSFANEIYQLVSKLQTKGEDCDYDRIIELATLDTRIGISHLAVPGPMPADDGSGLKPGWSGSCFIKDCNALIFSMKSLGVDSKVLNGAWQKNLEVRPERDWEKLIGRAISKKEKE